MSSISKASAGCSNYDEEEVDDVDSNDTSGEEIYTNTREIDYNNDPDIETEETEKPDCVDKNVHLNKSEQYFQNSHTRLIMKGQSDISESCSNMVADAAVCTDDEPNKKTKSPMDLKNFDDTESDPSLGENFQAAERSDPVVIMWEKSTKQKFVESSVIVKFILQAGDVFTHAFPKDSKVSEMKQFVAEIFKVPVSIVQLEHNGNILQDNLSVSDHAIERFGSVSFQLTSLEPCRYPLRLNNVYPDLPTNDVLTVTVQKGERIVKEIIVEIENRAIRKPFLGGYRHKITGLEYHHAFSQTASRQPKENTVSRDTQTLGTNKTTETNKEKVTQTYYDVHCFGEKILFGDPERFLVTQENEKVLYQKKIILIQRNLRSWLVRKMMMKMKAEYKRCIEWEKSEQLKKTQVQESRKEAKEAAVMYPASRGDFELLYHNIELWRESEEDRIKQMDSVALRKAELCTVLDKEIDLINSIESHRMRFQEESQKIKQEYFLLKTAAPLKFKGSNGQILSMDSLGTQRARELKIIYDNLRQVDEKPDGRIKQIKDVKSALQKNENSLTTELISLLDQECQILVRNIYQVDLYTLRKRIEYLFLQYIKDPKVNPEAAKHLPQQECVRVQFYKCCSCQKVLPYYKYPLHTKASDLKRCVQCCWLRMVGGPRFDVGPIRHIMNAVRRDELKQSCYTSVALIMQEQDFYHLIVNVWLAHSAIGGSGNLEELKIGRWDFTQNWSPWNCILLTSDELKAHLRFPNPEQIYSPSFVKKIKQRHQLGRIHFSELVTYSLKRTRENIQIVDMIRNFKAVKARLEK